MQASATLPRPFVQKARKMHDRDAIISGYVALACTIIITLATLWIAIFGA